MNQNLVELLIWILSYELTEYGDNDEHKNFFREIYDLIKQKYAKIEKKEWDLEMNNIYKSHMELGNKMINFYYSHFTDDITSANNSLKFIERLQNGKYMSEFEELNLIGNGTYGSVFKAKNRFDKMEYAIKKVKYNGN
jgi:hypothetical protein